MPPTHCTLVWYPSSGGHLHQLYTGFLMLHKRGLIGLAQQRSKQPLTASAAEHLKNIDGAHLSVVVNGSIRVHYDCHDAVELNERQLEDCDFYFKRSFSGRHLENYPRHRNKVFPLGLYYRVFPDTLDLQSIRRALVASSGLMGRLRALLDFVDSRNVLKYNPRVRHFESLPAYRLPPKVLFLAAVHDPYSRADRSREKIEEMTAINDTRAKCIQVLRKELGPAFLGGIIRNAYAVKSYKASLVQDSEMTRKRRYVGLLRSFPICIATTGLHGSIGGKFGEYVALSKAIVSERLNYEVPGELQPGRNYLEFVSPEQCAEQCIRLIEDRDERHRLMLNNALYYQSHLRADSLVLNSLLKVLSASYAAPEMPLRAVPQKVRAYA